MEMDEFISVARILAKILKAERTAQNKPKQGP